MLLEKSSQSTVLGVVGDRVFCAGIASYSVRGASALETAYRRADYIRALTSNFYGLEPLLAEIIPSPSRRPTHFLLFQIDDAPIFKGVFSLVDTKIDVLSDRLATDLARDWPTMIDLPSEDQKRYCCKLAIAHWILIR